MGDRDHLLKSTRARDVEEAINAAAADAGDRVFAFAARFTRHAEYRPIEALADDVQAAIVDTFVRVLREQGDHRHEHQAPPLPGLHPGSPEVAGHLPPRAPLFRAFLHDGRESVLLASRVRAPVG